LLIGVHGMGELLLVVLQGLTAMLLFVSATQGWLLTRNRWWETALLLLIAFSLFRPGYWRDQFFPPLRFEAATQLQAYVQSLPTGMALRLRVVEAADDGTLMQRDVRLTIPDQVGDDPLRALGFITEADGDTLAVADIRFMSPAEAAGLEAGFARRIEGYYTELQQPDSDWFLLPPLLFLGGVIWRQHRRKVTEEKLGG